MSPFGSQRLPRVLQLSMRLEKMLRLGDTGRIYIMADLFNVLNSTIENRRYQKYIGTAYIYPNAAQNRFVPYLQNLRPERDHQPPRYARGRPVHVLRVSPQKFSPASGLRAGSGTFFSPGRVLQWLRRQRPGVRRRFITGGHA